jgi:hypothetical protein
VNAADIIRGRGGLVILPAEWRYLVPQVMAKVDAIAAEVDTTDEVCS